MNTWRSYYQQLSERDQRILQLAAPLAGLLLLGLLVTSSYQYFQQQRDDNTQLLSNYQWLRSQTRPLVQWRAEFGRRSLGQLENARELGALLNSNLSKFGINGVVSASSDNRWQLIIKPSNGDRVLSFIEAAVGSGASPEHIKLTRADTNGSVSGSIMLRLSIEA